MYYLKYIVDVTVLRFIFVDFESYLVLNIILGILVSSNELVMINGKWIHIYIL